MEILDKMEDQRVWQEFLQYKIEKRHLSTLERKELEDYTEKEAYISLLKEVKMVDFCPPVPTKKEINKEGVSKKRVVYS